MEMDLSSPPLQIQFQLTLQLRSICTVHLQEPWASDSNPLVYLSGSRKSALSIFLLISNGAALRRSLRLARFVCSVPECPLSSTDWWQDHLWLLKKRGVTRHNVTPSVYVTSLYRKHPGSWLRVVAVIANVQSLTRSGALAELKLGLGMNVTTY